ncbi:RhuM family protein, partial [Enterobacter cloacae]|uniref:RhuM family protein n=1 Tax=Enterobacter cloacae TaxID=550 RepID=UPI0032AF738A
QNKLHFACTGLTAAELIHQRADATQPYMGLTSYKGEEVRKSVGKIVRSEMAGREGWLGYQQTVSEIGFIVRTPAESRCNGIAGESFLVFTHPR